MGHTRSRQLSAILIPLIFFFESLADGQFHQTIQVLLRCRGEAPDNLLAKLDEVRQQLAAQRQRQQRQVQAVVAAPPPPPVPAPPPAPVVIDEALLQQLIDMVGMYKMRDDPFRIIC